MDSTPQGYSVVPLARKVELDAPPGAVPIARAAIAPVRPYPGFAQALGLVGLLLLTELVLSVPLGIVAAIFGAQATDPFLLGGITLLATAVVLRWGWKRTRVPRVAVFPFRRVRLILFVPMALTVLGAAILLSELDNVCRTLLPMPKWIADVFENLLTSPTLAGSAFLLVIVAPVAEETLFRGLILRGFLLRYSRPAAMLLSALIFACAHLNPWQFASAFVLGVVFAWWFVRTGSVVPGMIGHALNNSVPLLIASMTEMHIPGMSGSLTDAIEFQPLWLDMLGLTLAGLGVAVLTAQFRTHHGSGGSAAPVGSGIEP